MMQMIVACQKCSYLFNNPLAGAQMAIGNRAQCPSCKTSQPMPDTFFDGEELVVRLGQTSVAVVKELCQILEEEGPAAAAERIRGDERFAKLHEWIPDSPDKALKILKILAYVCAAYVVLADRGTNPTSEQTFDLANRSMPPPAQVQRTEE